MFGEVCASDPEDIVAQVGLSTVAEREGNLAEATQYSSVPWKFAQTWVNYAHGY
jgi:hypothetical protein